MFNFKEKDNPLIIGGLVILLMAVYYIWIKPKMAFMSYPYAAANAGFAIKDCGDEI